MSKAMTRAKDCHHIIPKVRCRDLGIPNNFRGNLKRIPTAKHRAWHTLFGAATPDEAIEIIEREWSLSEDAKHEFNKLRGNVELIKSVRRRC